MGSRPVPLQTAVYAGVAGKNHISGAMSCHKNDFDASLQALHVQPTSATNGFDLLEMSSSRKLDPRSASRRAAAPAAASGGRPVTDPTKHMAVGQSTHPKWNPCKWKHEPQSGPLLV